MESGISKHTFLIKQKLPDPTIELRVGRCIDDLKEDWITAQPGQNLLLQYDYLAALEAALPHGMQVFYLVFYRSGVPIGVALVQFQRFRAEDSIRLEERKPCPSFFQTFAQHVRGLVASRVEFNTLVCGNLLFTGEHGFHFDDSNAGGRQVVAWVMDGLAILQQQIQKEGHNVSAILIKEFYNHHRWAGKVLTGNSYNEFTIQPNMILDLDESWTSFDDYLAALLSKYRVRARRAFGKLGEVEKRELTIAEVETSLDRMYDLYRQVAENSGFNVVNLNRQYLFELKRHLPQSFRVHAYYLEGKLIAFYTTLQNGHELEAHFLGFDQSINQGRQLYLNILFDLIRHGIEAKVKRVIFARTALAIKSSVGAKAHEMYCYMRHRNSFSNRFVQPILEYLRPEDDWEPRHPFKK